MLNHKILPYFSAKYVLKSRFSAFLTAILYFSSQAALTNVFLRVAIGEALAMVFIPIVIAALYNIVYDNFSKPYLLIIAFLGLIFSHTITLFLSIIISAIFLAINVKKLFCDSEKPKNYGWISIAKIVLCAVTVLLLSVGYWLPMLEQFASGKFQVSEPWTHVGDNALRFYELFNVYRPGVGIALLLTSIYLLGDPKSKKTFPRRLLCGGLLVALLTTSVFPWELLNNTLFDSIQFPWRMLPYSALLLSFGIGGCLGIKCKQKGSKAVAIAFTGIAILLVLSNVLTLGSKTSPLSESITNNDWALGWGEWMPQGTDKAKLDFQGFVKASDGEMIELTEKSGSTVRFQVDESQADSDFFEVPLLYYKGYSATAIKDNGEKVKLEAVVGENNVVRVASENISGEITVAYTGTTLQTIAYIINFVSLVSLCGYIIFARVKRRKE